MQLYASFSVGLFRLNISRMTLLDDIKLLSLRGNDTPYVYCCMCKFLFAFFCKTEMQ